jgi:lipopolysaccharide transport system permease protein
MPLAKTISGFLKFFIQLGLFLLMLAYYCLFEGMTFSIHATLCLLPLLFLLMALLGLGSGIILSSLTTKYRDLIFLINFGVQLLMYATPIIIPLSDVPLKYQWIMQLNPMTPVIETFRYSFFNVGVLDANGLYYSGGFALVLLLVGLVIFNKVEKSFVDTI